MKSKKVTLALLMMMLILSGCAALMFGVAEMSGTPEIKLAKGEEITVHLPTVDESLAPELSKGKMTVRGFASMIQQDFVIEFNDRGITATEGDSEDGNYLKIHVNEYKKGVGILRVYYVPILSDILAKSKLGGVVSLYTPGGKREVEVNKRGHKRGAGSGGDQTKKNIEMMTKATTAKLTK
ncbi:MAG: hypothetical protein IIA61_14485 [Candidatus Marinimicrobia bacterium]|nr:hypothetical protein [Candidatus Neomarinimicrobiota bacterium]